MFVLNIPSSQHRNKQHTYHTYSKHHKISFRRFDSNSNSKGFGGMAASGVQIAAPALPPVYQTCLHLTGMLVGCDTIFYWTHRALHHPLLYKRIHKQHHQYTESNVWASEYFGVVDIVLNILPGIIPALLMQSHFYVLLLFTAMRQWQTVQSHAGYDLPFDPLNRGIFHGKLMQAVGVAGIAGCGVCCRQYRG